MHPFGTVEPIRVHPFRTVEPIRVRPFGTVEPIRVHPFGIVETWKFGGIHLAEDSLKSALEGGDET